MRLILISDTHSLHDEMSYDPSTFINPNDTNILIHSGDCTNVGKEREVIEFVQWFQNIKGFDHKIFIAGNHDFAFETKPEWLSHYINDENLSQSDVTYLEDSEFIIEDSEFSRPIKFYGSPWQPNFYDWAFNLPRLGKEIEKYWSMIPDDTDVLITHGPPNEIRDHVQDRGGVRNVGCELLRFRIEQLSNLLVHIFGHIHGSYGAVLKKDTLFVNASTCTEQYEPINKPLIVDLKEHEGKIIATYVQN